ncbi:hypothetical protein [Nocardia sp. NPDC024068]|uniref:hypothetical protein n=1 Tax=Nocardia sp. NPDC024068 TaxID=3157197 RepID=UPI0033E6B04F
MRSRAARWSIPIIAFVLALPLCSGCAIDKGTALAADFEKHWAGKPDVEKVEVKGYNTLPFAGLATGVLVLADGTPPDRVVERAYELRDYVARHGSVTGRIAAGGFTVTVDADETRTREVMALWRSLAADQLVPEGDIHRSVSKIGYRWQVEVTAVDSAAAMAAFDNLTGGTGPHRPLSDVTSVEVLTRRGARGGIRVRTDANGARPTDAIAAYEAVVAEYPVSGAVLEPASARIVVAKTTDPDAARELARTAAPGLGPAALTVTVEGGA